jgi:hypothetical protein
MGARVRITNADGYNGRTAEIVKYPDHGLMHRIYVVRVLQEDGAWGQALQLTADQFEPIEDDTARKAIHL